MTVIAAVDPKFLVQARKAESMNCWKRSVFLFFFGGGAGGLSGGRHGSSSDWKVGGGIVAVLLREELLLAEVTDDKSVSMLWLDDSRLVVEEEELAVSSTDHGVEIEFVLHSKKNCVAWYWKLRNELRCFSEYLQEYTTRCMAQLVLFF